MDAQPTPAVTTSQDGDVAVIRIDDGKANALSHEVVAAVAAAVADAATGARAVALIGREGRFSGGFDLATMRQGPAQAMDLLEAGARLALDLYACPVPVVLGCTGHAVAMGAILLLTADHRVGAEGPFKIGMNEVAIGMPVPRFAAALARDRLSPRHLTPALQLARIYDPAGAVEAGYLDELVPAPRVAERAVERAAALAASLDPGAFRATRTVVRGAAHATFASALAEDRASVRDARI